MNESLAGSYVPRRAWFETLIQTNASILKLSIIAAGDGRLDSGIVQRTIEFLNDGPLAEPPENQLGCGFVILHQGEEGRWLLVHYWLPGGIASRRLYRADLPAGSPYGEADHSLFACVWELGLIEFERQAWMSTVMAGMSAEDYLAARFEEGKV